MVKQILVAIISLFFPEIGQIYAGAVNKGILMFIIAIILSLLSWFVFFNISIISFICAIYASYDAYNIAKITE